MSTYHKAYYQAHKAEIRASQKKYYEKNKAKIFKKYAHHRRAWDKAHSKYLAEHARLRKEIEAAGTRFDIASVAITKKNYLRELHAKGIA